MESVSRATRGAWAFDRGPRNSHRAPRRDRSTDAEAATVAREGAKWLLRTYVNPKAIGAEGDPLQRYVDSVVIHGSPDRVVDEIARLREEIHLEYLIAAPLSHQTFLSFTDHVLPRLHS